MVYCDEDELAATWRQVVLMDDDDDDRGVERGGKGVGALIAFLLFHNDDGRVGVVVGIIVKALQYWSMEGDVFHDDGVKVKNRESTYIPYKHDCRDILLHFAMIVIVCCNLKCSGCVCVCMCVYICVLTTGLPLDRES